MITVYFSGLGLTVSFGPWRYRFSIFLWLFSSLICCPPVCYWCFESLRTSLSIVRLFFLKNIVRGRLLQANLHCTIEMMWPARILLSMHFDLFLPFIRFQSIVTWFTMLAQSCYYLHRSWNILFLQGFFFRTTYSDENFITMVFQIFYFLIQFKEIKKIYFRSL